MPKCKYCKREIELKPIYKIRLEGQKTISSFCNEECYNLYINQPKDPQVVLTDYIQELYINNGYDRSKINWLLIIKQVKNLLKENKSWKHSGIKYTLWYMVEILEMNLFNGEFNGSILNLVPYYYNEAKDFCLEKHELDKRYKEVEFEEEEVIIKKQVNKKINLIDITEII